ncbi:acyl-CoA dehydrogenase family protein [Sporosarcina sp. CAU 1771]
MVKIDSVSKDELQLFKKSIQAFSKKHLESDYLKWEKDGNIPRELWNTLGEEGLLCIDIPEKYGGMGAPFTYSSALIEEFCYLNYSAISTNISVHSNIVAHYLLNSGTEDQKNHYLPKMATGELIGAIAMTEPNAGSDLQGIKTTAIFDEEQNAYILNGSKTFITNGQHCDFVVVAARTDLNVSGAKGTTLFIVDLPSKGFTKGKNLDKIGLHACDTSEQYMEDVVVPAEKVLGTLNRGFEILMMELSKERLIIAVGSQGAMEGILELTIDYVKEREAFGKPISHFQNTRFRIAEMKTEVRLHRTFVDECIRLVEHGELDTEMACMAKLSCSEAQGRITDGCLQLFGGYGYMQEYPVARAFVDARVQRIYGGTSEIMKEVIGKNIFGK